MFLLLLLSMKQQQQLQHLQLKLMPCLFWVLYGLDRLCRTFSICVTTAYSFETCQTMRGFQLLLLHGHRFAVTLQLLAVCNTFVSPRQPTQPQALITLLLSRALA